jgi:hypothetical protein
MDYKQVYKNTGMTPRTTWESAKNSDYATPIWRCESENVSAMRLLGFMVGILGICLSGALLATAVLSWFGVIAW